MTTLIIADHSYDIDVTMSVYYRYVSSIGVPVAETISYIPKLTMDDIVSLCVMADKTKYKGNDQPRLSKEYIYECIDIDGDVIATVNTAVIESFTVSLQKKNTEKLTMTPTGKKIQK